jgi:hypothetical protein
MNPLTSRALTRVGLPIASAALVLAAVPLLAHTPAHDSGSARPPIEVSTSSDLNPQARNARNVVAPRWSIAELQRFQDVIGLNPQAINALTAVPPRP